MNISDLESRFGKTRVTAMLASLRQLENTNSRCFQALITRAVLSDQGAFELPLPKDMLLERIKRHTDALDDRTALSIGEDISKLVLAYITAEALL
jgi:hypothetical protein